MNSWALPGGSGRVDRVLSVDEMAVLGSVAGAPAEAQA